MKYPQIFLIISMMALCHSLLLWADVKSTTGEIKMDANNDDLAEATLSSNGLVIGQISALSANLVVAGNGLVSKSLSVGGSSAGSNLSLHGSYSQSHETVTGNVLMDRHSVYFADTSSSNVILQLPPATTSHGRQITIKKTSKLGALDIVGGLVETASSYQIPAGGNYLPSLELINSANTWRIINSYGVENPMTQRLIFHAKLDETGTNPPVDSVTGLVGIHRNFAFTSGSNIGESGNIGLAAEFSGNIIGNDGDFITFEPGGAGESYFDMQTFTLSARVFLKPIAYSLGGNANKVIVKRGSSLTLNYNLFIDADDQLKLVVRTPSYFQVISTNTITPNVWTHVVGVHDGLKTYLYIDGVVDPNTKDTGEALVQGESTGLDIGGSGGFSQNFNGLIDDVRIYNYALTPTQISSLYLTNQIE
jgi:hypothetical protein